MEDKSHALIAGLFMIALSVALALAFVWFGRDTKERLPYELTTNASVSGLSEESSVRYRGMNVGKVESIRFDPEVPGQILVRVVVEKGTPITHSAYATLGYLGVTGLAYIQFDDDGSSRQLLESSPEHMARISIRPGLYDKLVAKSEVLMQQLGEIANSTNTLLGPENQHLFRQTLVDLDATVTSLGKLEPKLEPALDRLPGAIEDTRKTLASVNGMASDFSRVAGNYDALANRIQEGGGLLARMSGSLERFDRAADSLQAATEHLSSESIPHIDQFVEDGSHSARAVGRIADHLGEQPQSLLLGDPRIPPGPGEPGYSFNP